MTKTDWAVAALNAATILVAVLGLLDPSGGSYNGSQLALLAAIVMAIVNGGWIIRRGSRGATAEREAEAPPARAPEPDELDARAVLDLDARLEALEQAQVDAARWRALVESGQVTGPAADVPGSAVGSAGSALRNGQ